MPIYIVEADFISSIQVQATSHLQVVLYLRFSSFKEVAIEVFLLEIWERDKISALHVVYFCLVNQDLRDFDELSIEVLEQDKGLLIHLVSSYIDVVCKRNYD